MSKLHTTLENFVEIFTKFPDSPLFTWLVKFSELKNIEVNSNPNAPSLTGSEPLLRSVEGDDMGYKYKQMRERMSQVGFADTEIECINDYYDRLSYARSDPARL